MPTKKNTNPNTEKSRNRYDLLRLVSKALFPEEENKHGGSKILTAFTEALYKESPEPDKLRDADIARITRQVLTDLLAGMDT